MPEIKRILAATDFSDLSLTAARLAADLAEGLGAGLTLLYAEDSAGGLYEPPGYRTEILPELRRRLEDEAKKLSRPGVKVETALEEGQAAATIVAFATQWKFDWIVIGTHGRSGVNRLLLGSVAEKVVRHASVPVLTVPPRTTPR